jgi:ABC-type cobalamin/Fe3+-siderophores transport system ATPase subunit
VTLVLTIHAPSLASALASLIMLMRHGQMLGAGPASSVLTADRLSATYGLPVQVFQVDGRRVILLS